MKKIAHALIARDIKRHFRFLFERGYKIRDIQYFPDAFGNWYAVLESSNLLIIVSSDRNAILLSFASVSADIKDQIGIPAMIYFLSSEQIFIDNFEGNLYWAKKKQFERLANLLKQYIDQITPYFSTNFEKYKNDLLAVQKKYNDISIERYIQKTKK